MKGLVIEYYTSKSTLYNYKGLYVIAIDKRQHNLKQRYDLQKLLEQYYSLKNYSQRMVKKKINRLYYCYTCEELQICMR